MDGKSYHGVIDLTAENNAHTMQFRLITSRLERFGKNGQVRVLEVGCSSGYFTELLRNHGMWVYGVEPYEPAAREARPKLDGLFVGTIEKFLEEHQAVAGTFDFIVFGDVLEHLSSPEAVLRQVSVLLSPHGYIVASVPNVTHYSVRTMLLEGQWHYRRYGIMDNTHLRFFSRIGLRKMLASAGLGIEELRFTTLAVEDADIFANTWLFEKAKHLMAGTDFGDAFQFVFAASREAWQKEVERRPRNILCLLPQVSWSLGDIRIVLPLTRYCRRFGGQMRVRDTVTVSDLKWANVLVVQRNPSPNMLTAIRIASNIGLPVIYDIDDLLTDIPPFLQSHAGCLLWRNKIIACLNVADVVTTTTERLKSQLQSHSDHVRVIPNCAEPTDVDVDRMHTASGPVTLLVASNDTVRVDMVAAALRRIATTHGASVRTVAIGPPAGYLAEMGVSLQALPTMTYDAFRNYLAGLRNAIGVIPLDDSLFSSCKSAIKYVDYSFAGIPSVCSAVSPYTEVVEHDRSGLLIPNGETDWFDAMDRLIRSPQERRRLAANALEHCRAHYSLDTAAQWWHDVLLCLPFPEPRLQQNLRAAERQSLRRSLTLVSLLPSRQKIRMAIWTFYKPSTWKKTLNWLRKQCAARIASRL